MIDRRSPDYDSEQHYSSDDELADLKALYIEEEWREERYERLEADM